MIFNYLKFKNRLHNFFNGEKMAIIQEEHYIKRKTFVEADVDFLKLINELKVIKVECFYIRF